MTTPKRFTIAALSGLALLSASTAPASAATYSVCATGCQFNSIQNAVNAVTGVDTIDVRAGTYNENVTIPAGKDGLTLRGAQAGVAADVAPRPITGQESVLSGGGGTAIRVLSSRVTVDGFMIQNSAQGVHSDLSTSGLAVVNNVFTGNGNSVLPDSNGELYSTIRHNTFVNNAVDRGYSPGHAIITGYSRGRLLVAYNRTAGPGSLFTHYGLHARDVTVERNRTEAGSWALASLYSVDDVVIQDNRSSGTGALALLSDTRNVAVYRNTVNGTVARAAVFLIPDTGPNRQTVIEGNNFDAPANLDAVVARPGAVAGELVVRYNRFAPGTRGLFVEGEYAVDARYNWWGCNAGPTNAACAKLDQLGVVGVARWPWLTLSVQTDSNRIENPNGGTTGWRATLLRDSVGTVHRPQRFPLLDFTLLAQAGTRVTSDFADVGVVAGTIIAEGAQGVDFGVRRDSETVRARVDYGPAPVVPLPAGPKGDAGSQGQNGSAGPQGESGPAGPAASVAPMIAAPAAPAAARPVNECTSSARLLSCKLDTKVARATKGAVYRAGRRVATGSVRVSGTTVRVSVGRRVPAGRYELVLTRGSRSVARLTVVVR